MLRLSESKPGKDLIVNKITGELFLENIFNSRKRK